jgi:predicted Zn-ribbon and HTH transcriptional regulator
MSVMSFKDTLDKVSNDFIDKYVTKFNSSSKGGMCSEATRIKQGINVVIEEGADLGDCEIEINQNMTLSDQDSICADINSRLMNMETNAKRNMINEILDEIIPTLPIKIKQNTVFIKLLREKVLYLLMNIDATIQANCSSAVYLDQNKNIYFLGKIQKIKQPDGTIKEIYPITCKDSKFEFSQKAIVKQFSKCIVTPAFEVLQNDPELKAAYDINPNQDCYYEEVLFKPCNGSTRMFKIKVVNPPTGTGTCPYVNGDIIQKPCKTSTCKVTDWEDWSPCINNKQTRTRKVLTPGDDCPNFIEERACIISTIPADLSLRGIKVKELVSPSEQIVEINSSNWFVFGFDKMPETQKKILYTFLLLLLIVFLYALI